MKKILSILLAVAFLTTLFACSPKVEQSLSSDSPMESSGSVSVSVPKYSLINSDLYYRDDKECIGYRVAIGDDATEEEMRIVFDDLCAADSYYLHTVWYYGLPSDVEAIGSFSVGMLEETVSGASPEFTPCTYGVELIESLRARASDDKAKSDGTRSVPEFNVMQEALVPDNVFYPVDEIIFTTTAEENGLDDTPFFAEGEIVSRFDAKGYDTIQLSTDTGDIYISSVLESFPEISEGDVVTVFFLYGGYSNALDGPAGNFVYLE
ncbi:MAG: hypothetical protein J1E06_05890 [Acutalibacter sp.]|nr:hypothetical protein [Acutalibacter sp.]